MSAEVEMQELKDLTATLRAAMKAARPNLERAREVYVAHIAMIEKSPGVLFGTVPPIPSGGYAYLGRDVTHECAEAVLVVLRKWVVETDKNLAHLESI